MKRLKCIENYEKTLYELFMRTPPIHQMVNVCEAYFGYFKTKLKKTRKRSFFKFNTKVYRKENSA